MVDHVISSMNEVVSYEYSGNHQALDIIGSGDVIAISDGVVEMVVNNVKYTNHKTKGIATYGNFVKIRHDNGKKSLYAHLKYGSVSARLGERISKGQRIGTMGATGNAYGTHLHFEVRNSNETRENPKLYLNGQASLDPVTEVGTKIPDEMPESKEEAPEVIKEEPKVNDILQEPVKETQKATTIETHDNKVISENKGASNSLKSHGYNGGSIVDGLKSLGIDSSFDHREVIAAKNGISNYHGSYDQNVYLLSLLKQGKLKA